MQTRSLLTKESGKKSNRQAMERYANAPVDSATLITSVRPHGGREN